ncbi:hypothetical protein LguiA_019773 [Lonicera macranthoides]
MHRFTALFESNDERFSAFESMENESRMSFRADAAPGKSFLRGSKREVNLRYALWISDSLASGGS